MQYLHSIAQKLLLLFGMGAITVAVSEFWFYSISDDVSSLGILLFYSILGYAFIMVLHHFQVHHFYGLFLAAAVFGFLVEGVPVPVLYSGLPFTIVWTSLAWHASLTIVLFWYWLRACLQHRRPLFTAMIFTSIGIALGLWNSFMWNATIDDSNGILSYTWTHPQIFAQQFLFGYLLFLAGHFLLSYVKTEELHFSRTEKVVVGILLFSSYALSSLFTLFPYSLILPVLLVTCFIPLHRHRQANVVEPTVLTRTLLQPTWRWYSLTALVPLTAVSTYWLSYWLTWEIEMNALLIITAGPISVWWFVTGIVRTYRS